MTPPIIDFTQPLDQQVEWHTEAVTGQCHAYLAAVLAVDTPTYRALCGATAAKAFVLDTCADPYCAGCRQIMAAALAQAGGPVEDNRPGGRMD